MAQVVPRTFVVAGGSGFLGSWTARALALAGHRVVALVRSPAPWRLSRLPGVEVVAADPEVWSERIALLRPHVVVSLDWAGVAAGQRGSENQWGNLQRQRRLVLAAASAGAERFVGIGSQAEYGPRQTPMREDDEPRPATEYGKAKVAALSQLRTDAERHGIQWVWARVFSVFGPLDNEGLLLSTVADSLAASKDVDLSPALQKWSYLYAPDAGRALALLACSPLAAGIYNVGHPDAPVLRDIITAFASSYPGRGRLVFGGRGDTPQGSLSNLEPDVARLRALGWQPRIELDVALAETSAWLAGAEIPDPLTPNELLPVRQDLVR